MDNKTKLFNKYFKKATTVINEEEEEYDPPTQIEIGEDIDEIHRAMNILFTSIESINSKLKRYATEKYGTQNKPLQLVQLIRKTDPQAIQSTLDDEITSNLEDLETWASENLEQE